MWIPQIEIGCYNLRVYVKQADNGKQYPPKYVIEVADHLANGTNFVTDGFNAIEAKNYFETRGYNIESKQEKFEITITASDIISNDSRFTNAEILNVADFNENYQIGASYFLKLKHLSFDELWTDYLQPLLQEYVRGMYA